MSVLSLIEDIVEKCEEIERKETFIKTLAGKAKDEQWAEADPGFTMLRTMAKIQADQLISLAQELRELIPD